MSSNDYSAAPTDLLDEIIREAELRLAAQLTSAIAADQRAMTFAGLTVAASAAFIGAAVSLKASQEVSIPIYLTALGLILSAIFGVIAARPVAWDNPGNAPGAWLSDIRTGKSLHDAKAEMAAHYDAMIRENERTIAGSASWLRASQLVALIALVAGFLSSVI